MSFACMYLCSVCMQCQGRPKEDIRPPGTRVATMWVLGTQPRLRTQPGLLTTELSLQLQDSLLLLLLLLFLVFPDRVSMCSLGTYPGICFVDQADLELTEIHVPLPHECWD